MEEEFVVLDTREVQLRSLRNFMYALGYIMDGECSSGRFVNYHQQARASLYVSFDNAVRLHNAGKDDWNGYEGMVFSGVMRLNVTYTPLGVWLAMSSKLVDKVKLGVKHGEIYAKDMMIKPLNEYVRTLVA